MEGIELARKLDVEQKRFFREVFSVLNKKPGYFFHVLKHVLWQRRASRRRLNAESADLHIPPFMIFSITGKCNLNCKGCYSKHLHHNCGDELSIDKIDGIIGEAEDLGISIILLAGGEPFLRKDIISVTGKHRKVIFPVFTNGTLIDDNMAKAFAGRKNILPIISLEGDTLQTDSRRGEGVYRSVIDTFKRLNRCNALYGASITLTRENYGRVTEDSFVSNLESLGCGIVFYIEYIPCGADDGGLTVTNEQREGLKKFLARERGKGKMIMISFPGDEEIYGGCLAAGRGFVHVSSGGNLEPCPFSPYSDINLNQSCLKDALKSHFLKRIREEHELLEEHEGGCSLWENRETVERILREKVRV